ncbi:2-oxoacid_dh domain-containing protein [Meloidogyne graminicola]|uniref:2-oxoacid_dh domain-containing protein n=1 Tax=Meloidogyne graminicola TaxID=189291 RepID=A0A8S9ZZQ0_9BILA|nr:2-oxoacid_dh domain-containing protein [Meloidogyne graminicola]
MVFVSSLIVRSKPIIRWIHIQNSSASSILIGPAVKVLLLRYNLNLDNIKKRSGPKNNLIKSDVLNYISDTKLSPIPSQQKNQLKETFEPIKLNQYSKQNIYLSKQRQQFFEIPINDSKKEIIEQFNKKINIPHSYSSISINTSNIKQLCNQLNSYIDLSIECFIIYACAQALKSLPQINVYWNVNNNLQKTSNINISLFSQNKTSIIFNNADLLNIESISKLLNDKGLENKQNLNTFRLIN